MVTRQSEADLHQKIHKAVLDVIAETAQDMDCEVTSIKSPQEGIWTTQPYGHEEESNKTLADNFVSVAEYFLPLYCESCTFAVTRSNLVSFTEENKDRFDVTILMTT